MRNLRCHAKNVQPARNRFLLGRKTRFAEGGVCGTVIIEGCFAERQGERACQGLAHDGIRLGRREMSAAFRRAASKHGRYSHACREPHPTRNVLGFYHFDTICKYLSFVNCFTNRQSLPRFGNIVDAKYPGAFLVSCNRGRQRTCQPLIGGHIPVQRGDEPLSRRGQHQRHSQGPKFIERIQNSKIVI